MHKQMPFAARHVCRGHERAVSAVKFSPDGKTLASSGACLPSPSSPSATLLHLSWLVSSLRLALLVAALTAASHYLQVRTNG